MPTTTQIIDPIRAVTQRDPYPYYAELVAERPFYFDDVLGCWVASSAEAVEAVLTDAECRVRPPSDPIPSTIAGTPLGALFGQFVRQNDGEKHRALKPPIRAALTQFEEGRLCEQARQTAWRLVDQLRPAHPAKLNDFNFRLPVETLAALLGVSQARLAEVAQWVGDYAAAVAPSASAEQTSRGGTASARLIGLFRNQGESEPTARDESILAALAHQAQNADADAIAANAVGFLIQSYEATAGLLGSTLLRLAADAALRREVSEDFSLLPAIIAEMLRFDSPVQNTRRFSATDHTLCGQPVREGDAVLVVLAAANRDPIANADPQRFDPFRSERRLFTFGVGAHACPGERLATAIAATGLEVLLSSGLDFDSLAGPVTYRPSANTRIPLFAQETGP